MLSLLSKIFIDCPEWRQIKKKIHKKIRLSRVPLPICCALGNTIALEKNEPVAIVVPEKLFEKIRWDIQTVSEDRSLLLPDWDIQPYEHKYPDKELVAYRINTLWSIMSSRRPFVIATTPSSLMLPTLQPDVFRSLVLKIEMGMSIPPDDVVSILNKAGYEPETTVEYLGSFARRGNILDFFSPAHQDPVRLEFNGDTLESIRFFSTIDQRSLKKSDSALILPCREWGLHNPQNIRSSISSSALEIVGADELEEIIARTILDRNFPGEIWFGPLFEPKPVFTFEILKRIGVKYNLVIEPEEVENEIITFENTAKELFERVKWEDFPPLKPEVLFPQPDEVIECLKDAIEIRSLPTETDEIDFAGENISIPRDPESLNEFFKNLSSKYKNIFVAIHSDVQRERLSRNLGGYIPFPVCRGTISESFALHNTAILSADEILGFVRTQFIPRYYHQGPMKILHGGLSTGDLVVHSDYGIARFLGIETLEIGEHKSEFLSLEFENKEKLYVPMENFHLVSPYFGPSGIPLSKLGGRKWLNTKTRAQSKAFEMAGELLRIYALRNVKSRQQYLPNDEWERVVSQNFPYIETPEQYESIMQVLDDMEKNKPMDRLVCGDVGFGKTEVALRAAVRTVANEKQVAVLAPTTVLALQHYETFTQRLNRLPINIAMLSRLTNPQKVKRIIKDLADGKIEIVIGTHAILSDKVRFANLGLLIIDEEQWFGVKHKEKIKSFRAEVDVLTLSATPIPRTLYLSIAGVRDISLITTPPQKRKPIFTQIIRWNPELFAKIIYQEIERGGQTFFVHNRIETINGIEEILRRKMPDVRFCIAHGQMPERLLERIILEFRDGKYDVLLSTAIIESGTDMPRVNTIIINDAHKFGLAQLYQLRGRVGRSDVQAYAYLVVPPYRELTEDARKRLRALLEHTELGSGYHLAMKDMEIRGIGNLLGKEQSGYIEAVGIELYSKMISDAVAEIKGQPPPLFEPIPFSIDFDAYIPKDFVADEEERLTFYQRLFLARRTNVIDDIISELVDRFGPLPGEVRALAEFLKARICATLAGFLSIKFTPKWIIIAFDNQIHHLSYLSQKITHMKIPIEFDAETTSQIKIPRIGNLTEDIKILMKVLRPFQKSHRVEP